MSQQGYSIGRDVTVIVIRATGDVLRFGKVTAFDAKPDLSDQKILGLDGETDHLRFYQGWSGSWKMERRGPDLDDYFAEQEANYYAGFDEPPCTVQQTIREPDGSVSQYRFERVLLKFDDPGNWSGDKSVAQAVSFMASRRIQQA